MTQILSIKREMLDITAPSNVEIEIREDGKVIWIHVIGGTPELNCVTVLRCCRIGELTVTDHRD